MTISSIYNYLYETDFYTCGKKERQLDILRQNSIVRIHDAHDLVDLYVCMTQLQEYYILQANHNFYMEVASLIVPYMTHEFVMWVLNHLNKDYKPLFLRDEMKKGFKIISKSFETYRDMSLGDAVIMALQDSESNVKEKIRIESLALIKKKEIQEVEERMRELMFDSYSTYMISLSEEDYSLRVLKEIKQKLSSHIDEAETRLRNLVEQNNLTVTQTISTKSVISVMTQTSDVGSIPNIPDIIERRVVLTAEKASVLSALAPPWSPSNLVSSWSPPKNQRPIITSHDLLTGAWPQLPFLSQYNQNR